MHEFSLAQNIIEIVEETVAKNNAGKVSAIELEIGTLSGVEIPALDMALESLQPGSVIEGAEIAKQIIKGKAKCPSCLHEFEPDDYFAACPVCGNFGTEIIKGKELRVKSIIAD
jgi:hydrogenase nickel incorporation protein HypA/HybF